MNARVLVFVLVSALVAGGAALAGANLNWSTHASGDLESPPRATHGQGQAIFHLSEDGTEVQYKLVASNIENVFMAHIHVGTPGSNGPIVVWLYPSTAVNVLAPLGAGRTDGVLVTGTFTAANLTGPLAGRPLSELVAALDGGGAYVNFHTNDGVAPTNTGAGDFPGGEIRADVR